jgi:hypothetical protein
MAFGKDLYVRTQSLYPPSATRYSIGIVLKSFIQAHREIAD